LNPGERGGGKGKLERSQHRLGGRGEEATKRKSLVTSGPKKRANGTFSLVTHEIRTFHGGRLYIPNSPGKTRSLSVVGLLERGERRRFPAVLGIWKIRDSKRKGKGKRTLKTYCGPRGKKKWNKVKPTKEWGGGKETDFRCPDKSCKKCRRGSKPGSIGRERRNHNGGKKGRDGQPRIPSKKK